MKKFSLALMTVAMIATLSSCGGGAKIESLKSQNVESSKATLKQLDNADEIHATKDLISWGDKWNIEVDGSKIGTVSGQALYLIGDTYTLTNNDGNFVGAESENFRVVNRSADFYDYNSEKSGRLEQEFLHIFYHFNIFEDDKLVGTAEQNFSYTLDADILDTDGKPVWHVRSAVMSIHDNVTVTKLADSEVSGISALWTALAMSEIYQASKKKN